MINKNHNSIYKVYYLKETDKIHSVHVFFGNNLDVPNPEELFKREPKNEAFKDKSTGLPIFNDDELSKILDDSNPIEVHFSNQQIHFDDSIGTIKLKIMQSFSNTFSLEQIYLFCMKEEMLNPTNIFQTLTQKNRLELTKVRLNNFLFNIHDKHGKKIDFNLPEKNVYDYDDILDLNIKDKEFLLTKVL
jgi:hypothetical protein